MKKKLPYLVFIFMVLPLVTVFSQKSPREKNTDGGFDFFFNAGMYLGNKKNANYYRGYPDPLNSRYADPDIFYIIKNKYWWEEIQHIIDRNRKGIILSTLRFENPSEMKYELAFSFGVGARYRFSESFALSFLFSQARLTAQGLATFGAQSTGVNPDQEGRTYWDYSIIGKERRNFFEMNIYYFFITNHPSIFPFLELGVHMNSVKVLSADLIVKENTEERLFSMINWYGEGTYYTPGTDYTEINPNLGGVGFGMTGGLGIRLALNRWAAIEPVVQVGAEKLNLSSYGKFKLNYNFIIRLVVGDKVFKKQKE